MACMQLFPLQLVGQLDRGCWCTPQLLLLLNFLLLLLLLDFLLLLLAFLLLIIITLPLSRCSRVRLSFGDSSAF